MSTARVSWLINSSRDCFQVGESGSGKPSKSLTTYVAKMDKTQGAALNATSEIAQAKLVILSIIVIIIISLL